MIMLEMSDPLVDKIVHYLPQVTTKNSLKPNQLLELEVLLSYLFLASFGKWE